MGSYTIRPGSPFGWAHPELLGMHYGGSLSDDNDASYLESVAETGGNRGIWAAPLPPVPTSVLDDPTLGVFIAARARVDILGSARPIYLRMGTTATGPYELIGSDFLVTNGTVDTYFDTLNPDLFAEMKPALAAGTANLFFASYPTAAIESTATAHLVEYWLMFFFDGLPPTEVADTPPRRLYPREGAGLGIGRLYPPPNNPQSGPRTGPNAPL